MRHCDIWFLFSVKNELVKIQSSGPEALSIVSPAFLIF